MISQHAAVLIFLGVLAASPKVRAERMSWLENVNIRLGVDLDLGGAITWLSLAASDENVINSYDWGRQVQMSFYSGPIPYSVGDKQPAKVWEGLGWNPIQSGDHFGHRSRLLEQRNNGRDLYVKCIPMQWPLPGVEGDCTFESWLRLEGARVLVRGRLRNARSDRTLYPARTQELPAVYANGPLHRIVTYSGSYPFAGEPVRELNPKPPPQWDAWLATERWSALVNDAGWGLGVWNPQAVRWGGGFNGRPGSGGPKDNPCGYLAPQAVEILDHDVVYDFEYELMLGTVNEIRAEVYRKPRPADYPQWRFGSGSRQGWHYANATDTGWQAQDALEINWSGNDPQIISPSFTVKGTARSVIVEAKLSQPMQAQLFWATVEEPGFNSRRVASVAWDPAAAWQTFEISLPMIDGLTQLRLDPAKDGPGTMQIRSIRVK